jgi:hypothetical protein
MVVRRRCSIAAIASYSALCIAASSVCKIARRYGTSQEYLTASSHRRRGECYVIVSLQTVSNGTVSSRTRRRRLGSPLHFIPRSSSRPHQSPNERPPDQAVPRSHSELFDQFWLCFGCNGNLDVVAFFEFDFIAVVISQRIFNAEFSILWLAFD